LDQKAYDLLTQLVNETRTTNRLLALAYGDAIEKRVRTATDNPSVRAILSLLLDGEMTAEAVQTAARSFGTARSTLYRQLADLERAGIVERPRRGVVTLSAVVAPYLSTLRGSRNGPGAGSVEVAIE
jgi:DNA-binding transcriptional ArsR family regulator